MATVPLTSLNISNASSIVESWSQFWFSPRENRVLHFMRATTGLLLLAWMGSFAGDIPGFLSKSGWMDADAYSSIARLRLDNPIPSSWAEKLLPATSSGAYLLFAAGVVVVALFTLGIATRITAALSYLTVLVFSSNPVFYDGSESLLVVLTLYLALAYLFLDLAKVPGHPTSILGPSNASVLALARPAEAQDVSVWSNLAIRLIQVHFALILFISGLHKLQNFEWWAGDALWYPLFPPFDTNLNSVANMRGKSDGLLFFLSLACYATLVWQIGFPFYAWSKWGRWVALAGSLAGWFWNSILAEVPIFGPAIFIACVSLVWRSQERKSDPNSSASG